MPAKKKILKKVERNIPRKKPSIEIYEKRAADDLDHSMAPGVALRERLAKRWKADETERELSEDDEATNEGDIEDDEMAGEEAYPEIEESMSEDDEEKED